jgi:hypothetical protein
MTQGMFVAGRRPASKKALKEAVAADPSKVSAEATSFFGNEFRGPITDLPVGGKVVFVGPDPYTKRNFFGTLTRTATGFKVV